MKPYLAQNAAFARCSFHRLSAGLMGRESLQIAIGLQTIERLYRSAPRWRLLPHQHRTCG
jgi:hypothetical protein